MNNHITYKQAVRMLASQNIPYEVLDLGNGWTAILTRYGGRLIGPFKGEDGESVLWVTAAMKSEESFRQFVETREVHLGGERFWMNPELRFYCDAPELFDDTYTVQDAIDPAHYEITRSGETVKLALTGKLKALDTGEEKQFSVQRCYFAANNPLVWSKELKDLKVDYCGYTQEIDLSDESMDVPIPLEPWVLTQVNPTGKFVTPFFGEFDFVDFYDPVGSKQRVLPGYAECDVTGCDKYKVGYRAAQTFGRMAFVQKTAEGWHLMVRNHYTDPSIPYVSEPWGDLGNRGCATFYYNDDLSNGGFAEFENTGITVGPGTGRERSTSVNSTWFFFGSQEDIGKIMKVLLGIDYKF